MDRWSLGQATECDKTEKRDGLQEFVRSLSPGFPWRPTRCEGVFSRHEGDGCASCIPGIERRIAGLVNGIRSNRATISVRENINLGPTREVELRARGKEI